MIDETLFFFYLFFYIQGQKMNKLHKYLNSIQYRHLGGHKMALFADWSTEDKLHQCHHQFFFSSVQEDNCHQIFNNNIWNIQAVYPF